MLLPLQLKVFVYDWSLYDTHTGPPVRVGSVVESLQKKKKENQAKDLLTLVVDLQELVTIIWSGDTITGVVDASWRTSGV